MKYFALFFLFPFLATAQLTVEIPNLESPTGYLFLAVYDSENTFMNAEAAVKREIIPINGPEFAYVIPDLPPGEYAIAVFHDSNGNKKLDKNFLGIPKEGYGFSNDARGRFGPPSFKAASFLVYTEALAIRIQLNN